MVEDFRRGQGKFQDMSDIALIVDDDVRLLEGLRRNLRGRVNVLTATDGSAALEILRDQGPIAVILCDMRMPGMDGIAVLRAARERFPETVRMMLTGNADQATRWMPSTERDFPVSQQALRVGSARRRPGGGDQAIPACDRERELLEQIGRKSSVAA